MLTGHPRRAAFGGDGEFPARLDQGLTASKMLASILSVAHNVGYPTLVLLVMLESGGVPVPGETALITAGVVAGQHHLQIERVIALAAAAAIVGDNAGYLIGRKGGRWLLQRAGPFARHRARVLEAGEPFFARHGPKAVFIGRWILGLRTWASWLAGATRMPWPSFSLWNAAGGISWATTIGLVAYYAGQSATSTIALFGAMGLASALGVPALLLAGQRTRRHRLHQTSAPPRDASPSVPPSTRQRPQARGPGSTCRHIDIPASKPGSPKTFLNNPGISTASPVAISPQMTAIAAALGVRSQRSQTALPRSGPSSNYFGGWPDVLVHVITFTDRSASTGPQHYATPVHQKAEGRSER